MNLAIQEIDAAYNVLLNRLRDLQGPDGYWTGRLSNSSLSTATAVSALAICFGERQQPKLSVSPSKPSSVLPSTSAIDYECPDSWKCLIEKGCSYLCQAQNPDGGFGDTDRSHSNIATTLLAIAAWRIAGKQTMLEDRIRMAQAYVDNQGSWDGLRRRYGKDKTFVVPILSNCALAGMVSWRDVSPLPFEAAALPQSWYRFAQIPVVSYAIPALVAIGQARFIHAPTRNPILWILRKASLRRTQRILRQMQPDSGGYLEATPLTSFVLMNWASIGLVDSDVAVACRKFIVDSVQADGSWPIDTNLATWVTSLAMGAMIDGGAADVKAVKDLKDGTRRNQRGDTVGADGLLCVDASTVDWLLSCQHVVRHPFTGAEPGGWGWTNLSGAVPDADDTPAALLALASWTTSRNGGELTPQICSAVELGVQWLLKLQNRDGGWPTFCRGWGKLPFDRSGSDLTAHAIRALSKWAIESDNPTRAQASKPKLSLTTIQRAIERGMRFLRKEQRPDGAWLPLWFGNQDALDEENPSYGTGRVLVALGELSNRRGQRNVLHSDDIQRARRGIEFLISGQNADGGWGGGRSIRYANIAQNIDSDRVSVVSTIEETSVVIEGLAACRTLLEETSTKRENASDIRIQEFDHALQLGVAWLTEKIQIGGCETSQPIGFYFAKLWYHEQMYPYVFAAAALSRVRSLSMRGLLKEF